ncbi:MAG: hypothetical protein DCC63_14750 [Nitrospira sp.]|nr:MAG: hypothetical protein DCC63_14750 [Nitrospira sp.]
MLMKMILGKWLLVLAVWCAQVPWIGPRVTQALGYRNPIERRADNAAQLATLRRFESRNDSQTTQPSPCAVVELPDGSTALEFVHHVRCTFKTRCEATSFANQHGLRIMSMPKLVRWRRACALAVLGQWCVTPDEVEWARRSLNLGALSVAARRWWSQRIAVEPEVVVALARRASTDPVITSLWAKVCSKPIAEAYYRFLKFEAPSQNVFGHLTWVLNSRLSDAEYPWKQWALIVRM